MSNSTNGTGSGSGAGGFGCIPAGFRPPPPGDYKIAELWLWKVVTPIIIIVGTFGNLLTVIVLFRQKKKLTSTAMFLLALAMSDTLLLYNAPIRRWIIAVWEEDIRHKTELGCKFSVYLTYTSIQFSSWLLVAVTFERLISVVWPHRVRLGCTPRNSGFVIGGIFLVIFGFNTHIFYGFGRSQLPIFRGRGLCEPLYESYNKFWGKVYAWLDFAVAFAIPFAIFVIVNSTIIYKLRKMRIRRRKMSVLESQSEKANARDANAVTIMLIVLSVVFFVCLSPVSIYFIVRPYWLDNIQSWFCVDIYEYIHQYEIHLFVYSLVNLVGYANASVNFFLYIISGSKYRAEIKALLLCRSVTQEGLFGSSHTGSQRRTTTTTNTSMSRYASRSASADSVAQHKEVIIDPSGIKMKDAEQNPDGNINLNDSKLFPNGDLNTLEDGKCENTDDTENHRL